MTDLNDSTYVERVARDLLSEDVAQRLWAIVGLSDFAHVKRARHELIETTRSDLRGELSIMGAIGLARMQRRDSAVLDAVRREIPGAVGRVAVFGGFTPALRLTYPLMVSGDAAWFASTQPTELCPEANGAMLQRLHEYFDAGRSRDIRAASQLMTWFEYVDEGGERMLFDAVEPRMPEFRDWLRALASSSSGRRLRPRWRPW